MFHAYGVPTYGLSAAQLAEWDAWLVDHLPPRGKIGIEWDGRSSDMNKRGLACVPIERRREIARLGGAAVPENKRSFTNNRELASAAGKKGGATRKAQFDAARKARVEKTLARDINVPRKSESAFQQQTDLEQLCDEVQEMHLNRETICQTLPMEPRGYTPRPRPNTAIIAKAAAEAIAIRESSDGDMIDETNTKSG